MPLNTTHIAALILIALVVTGFVTAPNARSAGGASPPTTAGGPLPPPPPTAAYNVNYSNLTPRTASINWTLGLNWAPVTNISLYVGTLWNGCPASNSTVSPAGWYFVVENLSANTTHYNLTNLTPLTGYCVTVAEFDWPTAGYYAAPYATFHTLPPIFKTPTPTPGPTPPP